MTAGNDERDEYSGEMELAGASATDRYKSYLIESLIELTNMSEAVMVNMLRGRNDPDVMNAYISRLVHLGIHMYPKLKGGGEKTKDLLDRLEKFKPWFFNPTKPISTSEEGDRIPELFFLVRECFEIFDLTNF